MKRRKRGSLKSGRSGKKVTSRKQAIAIGLSEARKKGKKVPRKSSRKGGAKKKSSSRKTARKNTTRKTSSRKTTRRKSGRKKSSRR
jgi:hypothetical protein